MPYMNHTSVQPETFTATDASQTELRVQETPDGLTVTVDPYSTYGATFEMTFDTKAKLIDWLNRP